MAEISAALVKQLREATNVSMMECKRALVEAEGDSDKAALLLRERGMAVAAKKSTRATKSGLIASQVADDARSASLIEVACETDFVARNEQFAAMVGGLAERALTTDGDLAEETREEIAAKVAEIGENIVIRRCDRFILEGKGRIGSYIHLAGKVGVLVDVGCGKDETVSREVFVNLVKDLTLHVAACSPRYLTSDAIAQEEIDAERAIYAKQVEDKPAQIIEKIVDGKIKKFFGEICLLDQGFVREPKQTVRALLADTGRELSDELELRRFLRFELGT